MREEEEFKWRLDEESAPSLPPRPPSRRGAAQKRPRAKEEHFARAWLWHLRVLREKHATGQLLKMYHVLLEKDFYEWGKPFEVTTEMVVKAGLDRKAKSRILRLFEQWGLIFLKRRGNTKNPQVQLRDREGRGENPFRNCGDLSG